MKKRIEFTKFFIPAAVLSFVFIVVGVISIITRGINFSIDFKPGYIEEVQISSKPAVEDVRVVLSGISGVAVKMVGLGDEQAYQIRV